MLILKDVTKTFNPGTVDAKLALNHVNLTVSDGDFITIIGANGAGKSTLFNAICGSFITDTGVIFLDDLNITMMAEHRRARLIGRLFQDPMRGTAPDMSIEENLALAAGGGGWWSHPTMRHREEFRARLALLGMGLEDRLKQPVGLLSGGQRQALTLLMATYNPPRVLLLDEHTAALDPGTAEKVLALTEKIVSENGLTCLMITHNMQDALRLGNRTIMMGAGQILHDLSGPERAQATVSGLIRLFSDASGRTTASDRMLLGLDLEEGPDDFERATR